MTGTTGPGVPHEVELKYRVADVAALRAWLDGGWSSLLPDVHIGEATSKQVEDRYFDTAREVLRHHGFGARLRRSGGRHLVSVKSLVLEGGQDAADEPEDDSGNDPLHRRIELEGPASASLDPRSWPNSPARELVEELRGAARLHGTFTIRQRRRVQELEAADGRAQLSLDEVRVLAGRAEVGTFAELEVEAVGEAPQLLRRVAAALRATGLVEPTAGSKEQQARQMVDRERAAERARRLPRVPKSAGVTADDPLAEAGRKVLRLHLARMLAAEAGTRDGEDIEDLHKMRVATRRMRSVWRVFDGAYRPKVQRRYVRELREVAAALGFVRDLDVQLSILDAWAADQPDPDRAALAPYREHLVGERELRRTDLLDLLDARRYQDFVSDYLELTGTPAAAERAVAVGTPILVRHTAGGRIWVAYEHLRARETLLAWADIPALHAVRIEAKRLRYTLESFREVLPPAVDGVIATVTALQDHLGALNDADIAAHMVRSYLMAHGPRLGAVTGRVLAGYLMEQERRIASLRRGVPAVWRPITGRAMRQALARVIATP
ncbi:MAG: CHAD domain-containing protein [Chloroflexi bacterium]|nr:CHAD domain-containing protein [Chloroflexota bacterium]